MRSKVVAGSESSFGIGKEGETPLFIEGKTADTLVTLESSVSGGLSMGS